MRKTLTENSSKTQGGCENWLRTETTERGGEEEGVV
jgi:hypothetical protein